jgi:hypothetical protein
MGEDVLVGEGYHDFPSFDFRIWSCSSCRMRCCPIRGRYLPRLPATTSAAGGSPTLGQLTGDAQHPPRLGLRSMWLERSTVRTPVNTSRQLRPCSRPAKLTTHDPPCRWRHDRVGGTNTPRPNPRRMSSGESGSTWTTSRFSRSVSLSQKDLAIRKAGSRPKQVANGGHKPQDQV